MRHPRSCPTPREPVSNPMACISDHTGSSDCWSDDSTERPAQAVRLRLYSDLTSECKQAQFAGIPWFQPRECQFSLRRQATAMILLAFGDFAGQKEILEQDRGLSLYCFLRNVAPSSATIHLFLLSTRLFRRLLRPSECVLRSIA